MFARFSSDSYARLIALAALVVSGFVFACLTAVPAYASTVGDFDLVLDDGGDPQEGVDYTWTDDNTQGGVFAIISEKSMVVANADGVEATKDHIVIDPGSGGNASVTLNGIVIEYPNSSCGIEIASGDCVIRLADAFGVQRQG